MKALVIAEKPSVARDIARVLKCTKNSFWCDRGREVCSDMGARSSCDSGRSGGI